MGGGEKATVPKGELVYRDDREVLTRNWVWRQCEKDKTTEETRNIFIPIDVLGEVGRDAQTRSFRNSRIWSQDILEGLFFQPS